MESIYYKEGTERMKKYTKVVIFRPDPFSKCPEEIQLAAYQLMRKRIEGLRDEGKEKA